MLAHYHFKTLFCGERVISLIFSELEGNTGLHYLYPPSRYPIAHPVKQFTKISSKTGNKIDESKKRKFTFFFICDDIRADRKTVKHKNRQKNIHKCVGTSSVSFLGVKRNFYGVKNTRFFPIFAREKSDKTLKKYA